MPPPPIHPPSGKANSRKSVSRDLHSLSLDVVSMPSDCLDQDAGTLHIVAAEKDAQFSRSWPDWWP